ncbi:MAG: hypothetical protein ACI9OJ_001818 [Myxococcota bacterium]|jgi:hypothetical protein
MGLETGTPLNGGGAISARTLIQDPARNNNPGSSNQFFLHVPLFTAPATRAEVVGFGS